jgi:hypothetical protein
MGLGKLESKWNNNGIKMESKCNQHGVKLESNWSQTGIRMISLPGALTPGLLQYYSRESPRITPGLLQDYSRTAL